MRFAPCKAPSARHKRENDGHHKLLLPPERTFGRPLCPLAPADGREEALPPGVVLPRHHAHELLALFADEEDDVGRELEDGKRLGEPLLATEAAGIPSAVGVRFDERLNVGLMQRRVRGAQQLDVGQREELFRLVVPLRRHVLVRLGQREADLDVAKQPHHQEVDVKVVGTRHAEQRRLPRLGLHAQHIVRNAGDGAAGVELHGRDARDAMGQLADGRRAVGRSLISRRPTGSTRIGSRCSSSAGKYSWRDDAA